MKKQEIKKAIFEVLSGILMGSEFRLKQSEDGFVRRIAGGRQMLGVPLWDYNPEFEFSLNICIRLNAVEDVFHQFSGSPPKYHAMSFTTMTRVEYFTGNSARHKVTTAEEVISAGNLLSTVIQDNIVPFFKQHEDEKAINQAVNCQQPGIDITQNPSRAMHAIIVARLAGNEDFESIVAKHRSDMQLAPDTPHPFNHLVRHLQAY